MLSDEAKYVGINICTSQLKSYDDTFTISWIKTKCAKHVKKHAEKFHGHTMPCTWAWFGSLEKSFQHSSKNNEPTKFPNQQQASI